MATWNAAFNASPAGGDNPSFGDDKIRELKVTLCDRWVKEHYFDMTEGGSQPRQGLHRAGSAVAFYQDTAPTQRNGANLAATDAGLLWIYAHDDLLKVWDGDSFNTMKAVAAGGAADTATTATTANNSDTVDSRHLIRSAGTMNNIPILSYDTKTAGQSLSALDLGDMVVVRATTPHTSVDFYLPNTSGAKFFVTPTIGFLPTSGLTGVYPSETLVIMFAPLHSSGYAACLVIRVE